MNKNPLTLPELRQYWVAIRDIPSLRGGGAASASAHRRPARRAAGQRTLRRRDRRRDRALRRQGSSRPRTSQTHVALLPAAKEDLACLSQSGTYAFSTDGGGNARQRDDHDRTGRRTQPAVSLGFQLKRVRSGVEAPALAEARRLSRHPWPASVTWAVGCCKQSTMTPTPTCERSARPWRRFSPFSRANATLMPVIAGHSSSVRQQALRDRRFGRDRINPGRCRLRRTLQEGKLAPCRIDRSAPHQRQQGTTCAAGKADLARRRQTDPTSPRRRRGLDSAPLEDGSDQSDGSPEGMPSHLRILLWVGSLHPVTRIAKHRRIRGMAEAGARDAGAWEFLRRLPEFQDACKDVQHGRRDRDLVAQEFWLKQFKDYREEHADRSMPMFITGIQSIPRRKEFAAWRPTSADGNDSRRVVVAIRPDEVLIRFRLAPTGIARDTSIAQQIDQARREGLCSWLISTITASGRSAAEVLKANDP